MIGRELWDLSVIGRELWDLSDPNVWHSAAKDLRALWVTDDRRSRHELAEALGYAGPSKVDELRTHGRRLRAAAEAVDVDVAVRARMRRAEVLAAALDAMQRGKSPDG